MDASRLRRNIPSRFARLPERLYVPMALQASSIVANTKDK
jgi:hypothetical protein